MKPIKLPIYHLPDGGLELERMDIEVPLEDCSVNNILFFVINAIGPSSYRKSCVVYSNNTAFICAMTMAALENKLYNECGIDKIDNE
ncbi:MAG: hypothetical protein KA536_21550 [Saprospiraceae bacterium]|nr:hypothetical protein [Saprospiraceae bacterium]